MLIKELDVSDLDRARMAVVLEKQWLDSEKRHLFQRIHTWKLRWLEYLALKSQVEARS